MLYLISCQHLSYGKKAKTTLCDVRDENQQMKTYIVPDDRDTVLGKHCIHFQSIDANFHGMSESLENPQSAMVKKNTFFVVKSWDTHPE
jgi:hypothetical protein